MSPHKAQIVTGTNILRVINKYFRSIIFGHPVFGELAVADGSVAHTREELRRAGCGVQNGKIVAHSKQLHLTRYAAKCVMFESKR